MEKWLAHHATETIGALCGLLLACCFLIAGFFRTIFIIVLVVIGAICGHYWPRVKEVFDK
ncbi:DUF2273 domain-containing protein [Bombilactobacillus thymidiniphilus]|uniref:DUF2273 domain-containing protein n=1 Tax=Bombilactobacillus thymidiniphilus TaxID=2923363 RepID=A0ABY4PG05_9LACO|nr:DUF2273 domain-containing protein [Bombilactobacillus thymidiniphilus]UQS84252.1 DUF2273 domain-containing protein [Bombilactobacillus thymidiniphilus]